MPTHRSQTLTIAIERAAAAVYAYAKQPANLPSWAAGLASGIELIEGKWIARSPMGTVSVRFTADNDLGVLDHAVTLPDGAMVDVPMRVIANGSGSEVMFTLIQRSDMSDAEFERDAGLVRADLRALKRVMEARPG